MRKFPSDAEDAMSMGTSSYIVRKKTKPGGKKDAKEFTRVPNKKICAKKSMGKEIHKKIQTQNMFESPQEVKINNNQQDDQDKDMQVPVIE